MKNYTRNDRGDFNGEQNEQQIPISAESEDLNNQQNTINPGYNYNQSKSPNRNSNNYTNQGRPLSNNYNTSLGRQQQSPYYATSKGNMNNRNTLTSADLKFNPSQFQSINNKDTPLYVPPYILDNLRPTRQMRNHNSPSDYLLWSILNIFICVLFAMPALFFSIQTREMKKIGEIKKAKQNSRRSLVFNIVASVVGILVIMLIIILRFALYQLFVHYDVHSYNMPIAGG